MTALNELRGQQTSQLEALQQRSDQPQQQVNVGPNERVVSVASGSILALAGLTRGSLPGLLIAGIGGALIYRGATGHCHTCESLGIDTTHDGQQSLEEEIAE